MKPDLNGDSERCRVAGKRAHGHDVQTGIRSSIRLWSLGLLGLLGLATLTACTATDPGQTAAQANATPPERVPGQLGGLHAFYYSWYQNPETDGRWDHWNHDVLPLGDQPIMGPIKFPAGDDIGANFYPELGTYSSSDLAVLERHAQMLNTAGIDVVVLSWWGQGAPDEGAVRAFMDVAARYDLAVSFHIEPFYKTHQEFAAALRYLVDELGEHPALHRVDGKPLYYVYDSYKMAVGEWQKLLQPKGEATLRGTPYDGVFIGLWVMKDDDELFARNGFDGFYTYFAVDGFVYGSTPANWPALRAFADQHDLLFVPCVGPGYIDDRIRPWNAKNTRSRQGGQYYDRMFASAIANRPDIIGVTSFNEWHEGTQIEPAVAKEIPGYRYEDYGELPTDYYLERTRYWREQWRESRAKLATAPTSTSSVQHDSSTVSTEAP